MPSIEACNSNDENLTSVSSAIEIFDRYKKDKEDTSDSEESFHLPLDYDVDNDFQDNNDNLDNEQNENINSETVAQSTHIDYEADTIKIVDVEGNSKIVPGSSNSNNNDETQLIVSNSTVTEPNPTESDKTQKITEKECEEKNDEKETNDANSENVINDESSKTDEDKCEQDKSTKSLCHELATLANKDEAMTTSKDGEHPPAEPTVENKADQKTDDILMQLDNAISDSTNKDTEQKKTNNEDQDKEVVRPENEPEKRKSLGNLTEDIMFDDKSNDMDLLNISMVRGTEEDDLTDDETDLSDKSSDQDDQDDHSDKMDPDTSHHEDNELDIEQFEIVGDDENDSNCVDDPMEIGNSLETGGQIHTEKSDDAPKRVDVSDVATPLPPPSVITIDDENSKPRISEACSVSQTSENTEKSNKSADTDKAPQSSHVIECFQDISDASASTIACDLDKTQELSKTSSKDEPEVQKTKRSSTQANLDDSTVASKKTRLTSESSNDLSIIEPPPQPEPDNGKNSDKDQTLITLNSFSEFMKSRGFVSKLSRADLEEMCLQKICEALMLKTVEGEQNQHIKKLEKVIDGLRKDVAQLYKQAKDLEIVNRNLMFEVKNSGGQKRPLVPIKITRSVGLQVRFNPNTDILNNIRKRISNTPTKPGTSVATTTTATTPTKNTTTSTPSKVNTHTTPNNNATKTPPVSKTKTVSQVNQQTPNKPVRRSVPVVPKASVTQSQKPVTSPAQKSTPNHSSTPPALTSVNSGKRQTNLNQSSTKKTVPTLYPKPIPSPKAKGAGVIDLTDEDDRLSSNITSNNNAVTIVPKTPNKSVNGAKVVPLGKVLQAKAIPVNQQTVAVQPVVNTSTNSRTAIPAGIRLPNNSVIASTPNGTQLLYVVPTINSNVATAQKVTFVNGVLSGNLNTPAVSVVTNRGTQPLTVKSTQSLTRSKHPAPLPLPQRIILDPKLKPPLPKPVLTIKKIDTGIILQWKMPYNLEQFENIASYQLYAYQETNAAPSTEMWRKVGDVKALPLPMACTLTQFADKNKYYFAVRSVDIFKRLGAFSDPEPISL